MEGFVTVTAISESAHRGRVGDLALEHSRGVLTKQKRRKEEETRQSNEDVLTILRHEAFKAA